MKLAVSYLSSNRSPKDTILRINETKADFIHADFMDGRYVKAKNINLINWYNLKYCDKPIEVHLMVKNPLRYIKYLKGLNIRVVYIHYSAYFLDNIRKITKKGFRVGLAINPNEDIESLGKYFKYVDKILVMSVVPGAGGQKFIPKTIDKLKALNKYRIEHNLIYSITIDGGINEDTLTKVRRYIDTAVAGSYICQSLDYSVQVNKLKKTTKRKLLKNQE